MCCRRKVSRRGCSRTRASSSPTTSPCRPSSRSASMRSPVAASRSSSSLRISGWANCSNAKSASAGPRQSASARARSSRRSAGAAPLASRSCCSKRWASTRLGVDAENVARRAGLENVCAELAPQPRDRVLERGRRGPRRLLTPEKIDEAVGRDDPAGLEQERGEEGLLTMAAQRDEAAVALDLERAQDPELKRHSRQ